MASSTCEHQWADGYYVLHRRGDWSDDDLHNGRAMELIMRALAAVRARQCKRCGLTVTRESASA